MTTLYDSLVGDLVSATEQGVDVEDYLKGREAGIDHDEVCEVFGLDLVMEYYLRARALGATHDEIVDFVGDGWNDFGSYVDALEAGATHDEIVAVCNVSNGFAGNYASALRLGATHDEVFEAVQHDRTDAYVLARRAGATHQQIVTFVNGHWQVLSSYAMTRDAGTTHEEAIEVNALSPGSQALHEYTTARLGGIRHCDLIEVLNEGYDIFVYVQERERGTSHADVLDWWAEEFSP
jgi:hypothetical protein